MVAGRQRAESLATFAKRVDRKSQIEGRTDRGHSKSPLKIALAKPRIDQRRLPARIGAHEQTSIGFFDAGDRRIEQIPAAAARIEHGSVLATIEARRAKV